MNSESIQEPLMSYDAANREFGDKVKALELIQKDIKGRLTPSTVKPIKENHISTVQRTWWGATDRETLNENFTKITDQLIRTQTVINGHATHLNKQYALIQRMTEQYMAGLIAAFKTLEIVNKTAIKSQKVGKENQEELSRLIGQNKKFVNGRVTIISILEKHHGELNLRKKLIEELQTDVNGLKHKVDSHEGKFEECRNEIDKLKEGYDSLTDGLQENVENLTEVCVDIQGVLKDVQDDIRDTQADIQEVEKMVYTCEERLATIEEYASKVKKVLFAIEERLATIEENARKVKKVLFALSGVALLSLLHLVLSLLGVL